MKKFLKITLWSLTFLITLIVLFYAEENWRGAREYNETVARLKAEKYPLSIAELMPPPIPDEDNIAAAPIFAEIFLSGGNENPNARLKKIPVIYPAANSKYFKSAYSNQAKGELGDLRAFIKDASTTLTTKEAAQQLLSQMDQTWSPLMEEASEALKLPNCRWPLAYEKGLGMTFPFMNSSLNLSKMFALRAAIYLELGQSEKAADDIISGYRLAWATEQSPALISVLVSITEQRLIINPFWAGCAKNQWQEKDLSRLQNIFVKMENISAFKQSLQAELTFFYVMTPQLNKEFRDLRILNNYMSILGISRSQALFLSLRPTGWDQLDFLRYATFITDYNNTIDEQNLVIACGKIDALDREKNNFDHNQINKILYPFTLLALPAISKASSGTALTEVFNHQAILACGLERYKIHNKKLPLTLNELMPEYLNKIPNQGVISAPMIYKRVNDQDYILYSIGWNMRDDGGVISGGKRQTANGYSTIRSDELDWVWASKPELYRVVQPQ
ncbi:MAG: hypothetical protein LBH01_11590 [Verrucomicrobiales bacterium]|jgi:hypothetical protein|nr:hypothetical protein [Verrucomicrobiales bacterium]